MIFCEDIPCYAAKERRAQHPRGIGAEKIMGPFLGLIAVSLFVASVVCFLISSRIKVRPEGE